MSRRMAVLKKAQDKLMQAGIHVPGHPCENRSFWLFPIVVPDIPLCYNGLIARGVDAYLGATQLRVIQPPSGSKYEEIVTTQEYFDKVSIHIILKVLTFFRSCIFPYIKRSQIISSMKSLKEPLKSFKKLPDNSIKNLSFNNFYKHICFSSIICKASVMLNLLIFVIYIKYIYVLTN